MNVRVTELGVLLVQQATPCRLDPERQREDKCSKATDSLDSQELLRSTLRALLPLRVQNVLEAPGICSSDKVNQQPSTQHQGPKVP